MIIYIFIDRFILLGKLKVEIALTNFYLSTFLFLAFLAARILSPTI